MKSYKIELSEDHIRLIKVMCTIHQMNIIARLEELHDEDKADRPFLENALTECSGFLDYIKSEAPEVSDDY